MKIAIVYDMIYPFNIGGAEIRNYEIAKRLARHHEVHLFGVKLWDGPDVIRRDGLTFMASAGTGSCIVSAAGGTS